MPASGCHHTDEVKRKLSLVARGRKVSEETKRKLSLANKGRNLTPEHKAKISQSVRENCNSPEFREYLRQINMGKKCSEETKRKMSVAHKEEIPWNKGRELPSLTRLRMSLGRRGKSIGASNPNWKGGIAATPYSPEFDSSYKKEISAVYKDKCALCEKGRDRLHTHHINFNKQDNMMWNLIPLCNSCHSKTNHNRPYWISLLEERRIVRFDIGPAVEFSLVAT